MPMYRGHEMSQFQKWTKGIVIGRTNDSKRRRKSRQELRSLRNFEDLIKREGQKERKRKTDRGKEEQIITIKAERNGEREGGSTETREIFPSPQKIYRNYHIID
jgi:hypothetical protein